MATEMSSDVPLYASSLPTVELERAVTDGRVPVAVYGLGKMGLPLAAVLADVTDNVIGVDVDSTVVEAIEAGRCPVDNEPGLPAAVSSAVAEGALRATTDAVAAAETARVHVVIVPTLVTDGEADLTTLRSVVDDISAGLSAGDLVCLESTVPPGTCRRVVKPRLIAESDLTEHEFGVAFCPERTASGRALRDIRGAYPKVVGGVDEPSTDAARVFYDQVTSNDVLPVSDATTAECVKVFEGVYRDVNIALANELATLADELAVDVREAIDTANTQPYCDIHRPGPGVGGHCIPYYPYFLIDTLDTPTPLLRSSRLINDCMPRHTVALLLSGLREQGIKPADSSVLVLGVAYRPDVDETRESPGLAIADVLREIGVDVTVCDPVVDTTDLPAESVDMPDLSNRSFDAYVLATEHSAFDELPWDAVDASVIVDGHDALDDDAVTADVYTIGDGSEQ